MRVASLINTNSSSENSRSLSLSSEGASSFKKILENVSGGAGTSGAAENTFLSEQQASLLAVSKHAATAQQSAKANTQAEASSKKDSAAGTRSKPGSDPSTTTSSAQGDASPQTASAPPQTVSAPPQAVSVPPQALVAANACPPLPAADSQYGTPAAAQTTMPASTSAEFSNPEASSGNVSFGPGLGASSAGSAIAASAKGDAPTATAFPLVATVAADSSVSAPLTAATPGISGAPADPATPSTSGTPVVSGAAALPSDGPAVVPAVTAVTQQSPGSEDAGSTAAAIPPAGGAAKTGAVAARSGTDAIQGRSTKASPVADHSDKHKAGSGNAAAADSSDGSSPALSVTASSSPDEDRSEGQKAQVMDPAVVQGSNAVVAQTSSTTPNDPSGPTGFQSAGSTAAAVQSQATIPASVPEAASMPNVNSAQLIQSVRHSEMRLGMQSDEFGSLSISTSLGRQVLSAQISTEHLELGRVLAAHLPAMEQKLSTAYGLSAKVELNNAAAGSNTPSDTPSGQQPQDGRQQGNGSNLASQSTGVAVPVSTTKYSVNAAAVSSSRLDVRG